MLRLHIKSGVEQQKACQRGHTQAGETKSHGLRHLARPVLKQSETLIFSEVPRQSAEISHIQVLSVTRQL